MSIFLKISIVFLLLTANVFAEEPPFPSKAITIYVPFSSGGTADQLTRLIAKQISQDINQNVNIQNNTNLPKSSLNIK